jgi:hypothetical protein
LSRGLGDVYKRQGLNNEIVEEIITYDFTFYNVIKQNPRRFNYNQLFKFKNEEISKFKNKEISEENVINKFKKISENKIYEFINKYKSKIEGSKQTILGKSGTPDLGEGKIIDFTNNRLLIPNYFLIKNTKELDEILNNSVNETDNQEQTENTESKGIIDTATDYLRNGLGNIGTGLGNIGTGNVIEGATQIAKGTANTATLGLARRTGLTGGRKKSKKMRHKKGRKTMKRKSLRKKRL